MIGNDCRCPGCGTCDAASEVSDLRKSLREWKQKHSELSRMNAGYIKHLHAAERERDELKSRLAHAEAGVVPADVHECGWQWRPVGTDTAFATPFGTIRQCRVCGCLVAGGLTACARCAEEVA